MGAFEPWAYVLPEAEVLARVPQIDPKRLKIARRERRIEYYDFPAGRYYLASQIAEALSQGLIHQLPEYPGTRGVVYVIGFAGYVKIGFSIRGAEWRLLDLQTGAPEKLEIYAELPTFSRMERKLHRRFAAHQSYGEWFRREGAVAAWMAEGFPL